MRTPRTGSERSGEINGQSDPAARLQHVERADAHHRVGIGEAFPRQVRTFAGEI